MWLIRRVDKRSAIHHDRLITTGQVNQKTGATSDPDADWGKHETVGIDARTGKQWKKIKSWFGYGLHLIADTRYEIPVAVHLTQASHSEQVELRAMIHELMEESPELAERCRDFSAEAWTAPRPKRCCGTTIESAP